MDLPSVAIIGGGVAGMTAALGLQDVAETVLFEARPELGGHILPVSVEGAPSAVDTGFVVFVPESYPQCTGLLDWLGVRHAPANTPFRITDDLRDLSFPAAKLLELCGSAIPKRCRRELLRLYQCLIRIRKEGIAWVDNVPLDAWMRSQDFDEATAELGVLPWVASFWGLQPETVRGVSARVALREIARNAGPGSMHRVVPSTRAYLDAFTSRLAPTTVHRAEVRRIEVAACPGVEWATGRRSFDHVVVAVDAPGAARMLGEHDTDLGALLSSFDYEATAAVVHRDTRLLPDDRAQWCTFHHRRRNDADRVRSVTTWVFDLLNEWTDDAHAIDTPTLLTTGDPGLLGDGVIDPDSVIATFRHRHLVSTPSVVDAVSQIPALDEGQPFTLAGSYLGVGALHEDAVLSGMRAATVTRARLGLPTVRWPWAQAAG